MKINLLNPFVYMFKDKSWVLKFLCILALFSPFVLSEFLFFSYIQQTSEVLGQEFYKKLALFFFSFIIAFLTIGNITLNTNRRIHENTNLLYEWRGNFLKIVKTTLSIYAMVFIIFLALLCFYMLSYIKVLNGSDVQSSIAGFYIFQYIVMFLYYLGYLSFIRDLKFVSFFNIPAIIKIVTKNYGIPFIIVTVI